MPTSAQYAETAHLFRATGFGVHQDQVEQWAPQGYAATLDWVMSNTNTDNPMPPDGEKGLGFHDTSDCPGVTPTYYPLTRWWLERMTQPGARLHEKMCLFWHSHFASSQRKSGGTPLVQQNRTIREHALGNFRDLALAMVKDPAMLYWLDGDHSTAAAPNENMAREFMELFTLGPTGGQYGQADVKEGARALSGWKIAQQSGCPGELVSWEDASDHDRGPIMFLGRAPQPMSSDDFVNVICDHPGTADFVAAKLFEFLVGRTPTSGEVAQHAVPFRNSSLNIPTLIESILASPLFRSSRNQRPRWPVVWYTAVHAALQLSQPGPYGSMLISDPTEELGQRLGEPPLVNGWPLGNKWASGSALARKATWLKRLRSVSGFINLDGLDGPDDVLQRCGIWDPSPQTQAAAIAMWDSRSPQYNPSAPAVAVFEIAFMSPEFLMT